MARTGWHAQGDDLGGIDCINLHFYYDFIQGDGMGHVIPRVVAESIREMTQ